jgi:hypothetical protein
MTQPMPRFCSQCGSPRSAEPNRPYKPIVPLFEKTRLRKSSRGCVYRGRIVWVNSPLAALCSVSSLDDEYLYPLVS